ncbi:hypothetical protein CC1G_03018 [Coprinopsis cinerea okayama7|uniref:Uncharacterized protein n=1 Tax=Coprinopsis cinerea (strain Okayama-7 / 130 / ATCC MYA-4618 / FGSC 9003) TaxID=240176 RepID=A8NS39_COPC7|nr:hypothetical protein CC1G_03018 [Coprinopsis cinerea okayama7\|eukprot:XP_001835930.2 hypothetical protein CC1G_03018 [Coprinopsis cinerea okayama7\
MSPLGQGISAFIQPTLSKAVSHLDFKSGTLLELHSKGPALRQRWARLILLCCGASACAYTWERSKCLVLYDSVVIKPGLGVPSRRLDIPAYPTQGSLPGRILRAPRPASSQSNLCPAKPAFVKPLTLQDAEYHTTASITPHPFAKCQWTWSTADAPLDETPSAILHAPR